MLKATYIRQCAHNLHERNVVLAELKQRRISRVRKSYLSNQLKRLNREKEFFLKIKGEFRITDKDCFRL